MTSYKKDCDSVKYLIPLYVKGILTDSQKEEFENALRGCPDLKNEIETWKEIDKSYKAIESKLPQAPNYIYPKIAAKIKESKQIGLFERFMPSRKFSLALAAAQLLIIIVLGVYVINLKTEYKTLSAPSITEEKLIKINIVFRENALEAEIRNLLLQINGRIIDGPYSSGLYVIGITSEKGVEDVLNRLRENSIVVMAERAY